MGGVLAILCQPDRAAGGGIHPHPPGHPARAREFLIRLLPLFFTQNFGYGFYGASGKIASEGGRYPVRRPCGLDLPRNDGADTVALHQFPPAIFCSKIWVLWYWYFETRRRGKRTRSRLCDWIAQRKERSAVCLVQLHSCAQLGPTAGVAPGPRLISLSKIWVLPATFFVVRFSGRLFLKGR